MSIETLQILFYTVLILSIIMYTMLDGFDLGVGMLHLFTKKDEERRIFLNAIGPVWDGNEVWLVIIVGGTFAGFPIVYASILSSFYMFSVLLLACLMFRAAAIEFRSKKPELIWRKTWDVVFSFSSLFVAFLIGLGLGNFIEGIPLDQDHDFQGNLLYFFKPYPIVVGLLAASLFVLHGSIFLVMKTEEKLQEKLKKWSKKAYYIFCALFVVSTAYTFLEKSYMIMRFFSHPFLLLIPILLLASIVHLYIRINNGRHGWAFISSCITIFLFMILYVIGTFPFLVQSTIDPINNSLTVFNSSSSKYTLGVLLIIVSIGVPLVLAYGYWIYKVFQGKVHIDESSY